MITYFLLSIIIAFLFGYNLGYRKGQTRGFILGLKKAPLLILEKSLELGSCLICNQRK